MRRYITLIPGPSGVCHLVPVHLRHNHISQHDADHAWMFPIDAQSLLAVLRLQEGVLRIFESLPSKASDCGFVFDYQDGLGPSDFPAGGLRLWAALDSGQVDRLGGAERLEQMTQRFLVHADAGIVYRQHCVGAAGPEGPDIRDGCEAKDGPDAPQPRPGMRSRTDLFAFLSIALVHGFLIAGISRLWLLRFFKFRFIAWVLPVFWANSLCVGAVRLRLLVLRVGSHQRKPGRKHCDNESVHILFLENVCQRLRNRRSHIIPESDALPGFQEAGINANGGH